MNPTEKWKKKHDTEFSGGLAPELDELPHSHAHPFRYAGKGQEGTAPRGQVNQKKH